LIIGRSAETKISIQGGAVVAAEVQIVRPSCLMTRRNDSQMSLISLHFWKNFALVGLLHIISWRHT